MYEVDESFTRTFLDCKLDYNAFNKAIKLAKLYEANENDIQLMIKKKREFQQLYLSFEKKVLKQMQQDSNIAKIGEGWYGVRYRQEKKDGIKFEILVEKDLSLLEINSSKQRDYSGSELDMLLPAYMDETALELYKETIYKKAVGVVYEYTQISIPIDSSVEERAVRVSAHAGKRWIQRKWQITASEIEAEEYRRSHLKEVEEDIIDCFSKKAVCVWKNSDGTSYWFDESVNIMYVVGSNNTIITLYEEDFGFESDINKSIVLMQLDVLKTSDKELAETKGFIQDRVKHINGELNSLDDAMNVLEAELQLLKSKKERLLADREENIQFLWVEQERFNAQYNKLFKKWDGKL